VGRFDGTTGAVRQEPAPEDLEAVPFTRRGDELVLA
jgi:Rieske Fe-S protein